jgi:HAD domain in Swiss Army Knife RNA repair proteins
MKAAKILFLDFDDVLNTSDTLARGELFEPVNVQALNAIVDRTDADIVVTSMWRLGASAGELEKLLCASGVHAAGRVLGATPWLADRSRGAEIQAWFEQAEVTVDGFVILDDRNDMGALTPHLVRTDPACGLLSEQVEEVVSRLADALRAGTLPPAVCQWSGRMGWNGFEEGLSS